MTELQIEQSLKKINKHFRFSGMNTFVEKSKRKRYDDLINGIKYSFNMFVLISAVVGAIFWVLLNTENGADFTSFTYIAPCIQIGILAALKSFSFIVYDKQVNELLTILRNMERKQYEENSFEKNEIVMKEAKFLNFVLMLLVNFNWVLLVVFSIMPVPMMALKYYTTGEFELITPVLVVYPFIDNDDIRFYPFIYLHQTWSNATVVFTLGGTDDFFYISTTFIRIQFELLQYDIERIIDGDDFCTKRGDVEFQAELVRLLKWHTDLIYSVDLLEAIYSKSTLVNFVSSSLLICLSLFNVTKIDDIPFVISFICFLIMSLFQIFTFCFFADMLMRSSQAVADAVYNSKWYLANPEVGKVFSIVHIRSMKPCKLTAYGYADVNLNAFTKIMNTAWSYFALLETLYSSPHSN